MHTLALDGRTGASGDMLLGALLAVGADRDALSAVTDALDVTYEIGETTRNGIRATTVHVLLDGEVGDGDEHDHAEDHDHHEDHAGDHQHGHDHSHTHAEGHGPGRTYPEVIEIVGSMALPPAVEADAKAVFGILGEAEASVHGTDLSETHFHEVGADDAVADVVGACLLMDDLGIERVVAAPVATGGGTVEMSHGTYPVPAPAVVEIATGADWRVGGGPVEAELLTPTGAAILAHFAEGVDALPPMDVARVGYGAGSKEFPDHPNVLRALVGETGEGDGEAGAGERAVDPHEGSLVRDDVTVLETNLDDVAPEVLGGLHDTLADAGARDVSVVPLAMKKSRPGHLVKVIVKPGDAERVARRLAEETGTLGIRETGASHRWIAERAFETADLVIDDDGYEVSVKVASDANGVVYDVSAEYDDAAGVAAETGLPIREVMRRAEDAVR